MKSLIGRVALGTALVGSLATQLNAQERGHDFEVRTRICDGNPMTVLASEGEAKYMIVNASNRGVRPVIAPYVSDPKVLLMDGLNNPAGEKRQSCRWAESGEDIDWSPTAIPSKNVSVRDGTTYISIGGFEFKYDIPKRK